MNIVLIGYRGTGKSMVGKVLATRLGWPLVSTDAEIVRRAARSVPEIVAQHGWEYFRDLESTVCREFSAQDRLIIDTGGGAILRQENVVCLKKTGMLFWLTASVETIASRIGRDTQRPSLTGTKSFVEEIEEVLSVRMPQYREAADRTVPTDGCAINQIVETILSSIQPETK